MIEHDEMHGLALVREQRGLELGAHTEGQRHVTGLCGGRDEIVRVPRQGVDLFAWTEQGVDAGILEDHGVERAVRGNPRSEWLSLWISFELNPVGKVGLG